MSNINQEKLYHYLPIVYQQKDQQDKQELRALLGIIEQELKDFELEIDKNYANIFIETCEPWAIPFIGDLLGIKNLHDKNRIVLSQRPLVANMLRHRRRKGQRSILEQVIKDTTGWSVKVVEFSKLLATTQHLQHLKINAQATVNIRDLNTTERINTAFDVSGHTVDMRDWKRYQVKYNINSVGIFIWRMISYPIMNGTAHEIDDQHYTFNPLGLTMPLYNKPRALINTNNQANKETDLPAALRRAALEHDLKNVDSQEIRSDYYGMDRSFYIRLINENTTIDVDANQIVSMDLSDNSALPPTGKIGVDVELGKIVLANNFTPMPSRIDVSYHTAFSASMAGGFYNREMVSEKNANLITDTLIVNKFDTSEMGHFNTLQAAITEALSRLNDQNNTVQQLIIMIDNNATYTENIQPIKLVNDAELIITAANGARPCLKLGNLVIEADNSNNKMALDGLLLDTTLTVQGTIENSVTIKANLALQIQHCTLHPKATTTALSASINNLKQLKVGVNKSILGKIKLPESNTELTISDSIIDAVSNGEKAITGDTANTKGPKLSLVRSTVFGKIEAVEAALISESIITDTVQIDRIDTGCVRYSSLPIFDETTVTIKSRTPTRYRCQPELSFIPLAQARAATQGLQDFKKLIEKDLFWWRLTLTKLTPQFNSIIYGNSNYAQLNQRTDTGIRQGAEDGAEMGVFKELKQPQRETNLTDILKEFLPFDLNAEIFYVN